MTKPRKLSGKIGTYEEWKAFGDEIKDIRRRMINTLCDKHNQDLVGSGQLMDILLRSLHWLEKFQSKAEDRMFEKVKPNGETQKWIDVFYGDDRDEESK